MKLKKEIKKGILIIVSMLDLIVLSYIDSIENLLNYTLTFIILIAFNYLAYKLYNIRLNK